MRKFFICITLLFACSASFAQMPEDGNYDNWNWEDQSRENWKKFKDGFWYGINPPFAPDSERLDHMSRIYLAQDYTKEKGWELLWARFEHIFPHFVLYNPHRGVVRFFFYVDFDYYFQFTTLSFDDINNSPGLLSYNNGYQVAPDKYLEGEIQSNELATAMLTSANDTWAVADFLMYFDPNTEDPKYTSKRWQFRLYGAEDSDVRPKEESLLSSHSWKTYFGTTYDYSSGTFNAMNTKVHQQAAGYKAYLREMQETIHDINSLSPLFLQNYKSMVESIDSVENLVTDTVGISPKLSAFLGFLKVVNGVFDMQEATMPIIVMDYQDVEGSAKFLPLSSAEIKIPGVKGDSQLNWSPYNKPLGYFNLKKTPIIRQTSAYEKYQFDDNGDGSIGYKDDVPMYLNNLFNYPTLLVEGEHSPVSGYLGKFVTYKLGSDIETAMQEIEGLSLIDANFALVAKLSGTGEEQFDITSKYIECKFWGLDAREYHVPVVNPIYKALDEGVLKIYKFDEKNDGIYIGTPELSADKLKNLEVELPEHVELSLRVIAKFKSDKYNKPIIFQANYKMDSQVEAANRDQLFWHMEQTNFRESGGDNGELKGVMTLYPNPSVGCFTIELSNTDKNIRLVEIYNSKGALVYISSDVNSLSHSVNLSDQPQGIYLIKVHNATEVISDRIILK